MASSYLIQIHLNLRMGISPSFNSHWLCSASNWALICICSSSPVSPVSWWLFLAKFDFNFIAGVYSQHVKFSFQIQGTAYLYLEHIILCGLDYIHILYTIQEYCWQQQHLKVPNCYNYDWMLCCDTVVKLYVGGDLLVKTCLFFPSMNGTCQAK